MFTVAHMKVAFLCEEQSHTDDYTEWKDPPTQAKDVPNRTKVNLRDFFGQWPHEF